MTQRVGQGGTVPLDGTFEDGTGALIDPTTPRVDILNPSGVVLVTDDIPARLATGIYRYDFVVPVNAPIGLWTARWTGVINGGAVQGDEYFIVDLAGSVSFDSSVLVTPDEVGAFMDATLTEHERIMAQIYIDNLVNQIEVWLGRPITIQTFTEVVEPSHDGIGYFRNTPVQSIEQIEELAPDVWAVPSFQSYSYWSATTYGIDGMYGPLRVRYTAGLDSPKAAKSLVLAVVAGEIRKGKQGGYRGVASIEVEDYTIKFEDSQKRIREGDFVADDLRILRRLKKKVMA